MIAAVVSATSTGAKTPLEVSELVVGFPVSIGVPDGSRLNHFEVSTSVRSDATEWRWLYEAFAPGEVGDIDITLDDQGPGAVALGELYDPILLELGFSRNGTTGSDPGEPGGPNSINHVYPPDGDVFIDGVRADVPNIKVWATEDLVFPDDTLEPGYRVDLDALLPEDVIPVPLIAALGDSIPVPDGAVLGSASIRMRHRQPDAFLAELGLVYVDVAVGWDTAQSFDEVIEFYGSHQPDIEFWTLGKPSFFDEGFIEETILTEVFGGSMVLDLLLLLRYPGTLEISSVGDVTEISFELRIEPNRPELAFVE